MAYINRTVMYSKEILDYFYKNLDDTNFTEINEEDIKRIFNKTKYIRDYFEDNKKDTKAFKYLDIAKKITKLPKAFDIYSDAQKYIALVLIIDPNCELYVQCGICNKINELKAFMTYKFGIYDEKLIKVEKLYVKNLLDKEKKKELDEIIEINAFK